MKMLKCPPSYYTWKNCQSHMGGNKVLPNNCYDHYQRQYFFKMTLRIIKRLHFLLTACSEAPMYLFSSSGPLTEINRSEQAAAAAPTICVLPQPGGPYRRTFDRILIGACEKIFGNLEGNSIIWHKDNHNMHNKEWVQCNNKLHGISGWTSTVKLLDYCDLYSLDSHCI